MENVPIDIHIPKLLEWLISRKISNASWQNQILTIREKVNNALQDMPERKDITELLSGTYINYFHCCRIVEVLKETEADTKNLFGRYGSQRMKDWLEIIRLYEKDNVYLAEAANLLLRTVKYEVPSLKKQISKAKQTKLECDKKFVDYEKNVISSNRELDMMRKQLGISGKNIRTELLKRVTYLDTVYDKILSNIKMLQKPSKYYTEFARQINDTSVELSLINFIIERGNTTTYEWLYGTCPQKIELPPNVYIEEKELASGDIDWDVSEHKIQTQPIASDDISWDIIEDKSQAEDVTDWGIEVEQDSKQIDISNEDGIVVEDPEPQSITVAKGSDAYTVLDNPKTREQFITQLMELQSFLKIRLLETDNEDGGMLTMLNELQETSDNLVKMLDSVHVIRELILDPTVEQLHFIKHSPRYIDKVVTSFEQKTGHIEKMFACKEAVKLQSEEAAQNESNLMPKLRLMMKKTKELQKQVEEDISKRYNNRPVHLIGGF